MFGELSVEPLREVERLLTAEAAPREAVLPALLTAAQARPRSFGRNEMPPWRC